MEQKKRIGLLGTLIGFSPALKHSLLADLGAGNSDTRAAGIAANTLMVPLEFVRGGVSDGVDRAFWSVTSTRPQDYAATKNLLISFLPELLSEIKVQQVVKISAPFGGAVFFFGRAQEPFRFCLVTSKLFSKAIANAIKRSASFVVHEFSQERVRFSFSVVSIEDLRPFISFVTEQGWAVDADAISKAIDARLRRVGLAGLPIPTDRNKIRKVQHSGTAVVRTKSSGTAEIVSLLEQSDDLCHRLEVRFVRSRDGISPAVAAEADRLLRARKAINEAILCHNKLVSTFLEIKGGEEE